MLAPSYADSSGAFFRDFNFANIQLSKNSESMLLCKSDHDVEMGFGDNRTRTGNLLRARQML